MSASTAAMAARAPRPPILSEQLAEYFRCSDVERINDISTYAACIMPLLSALGWRPYSRDLIDTFPHFADHFDLVDLLNVLVNLGYQSDPQKTRMDRINPSLLPCLFVAGDERVYVITEDDGECIEYFDAEKRCTQKGPAPKLSGTAYVITNVDVHEELEGDGGRSRGGWFASLMGRFRGIFVHLLGITMVINVLALAIPLYILAVYDQVIGVNSSRSLPYLVVGIAIILLAELLLRYLRSRTLGLLAGRMDYLVGVETFAQVLNLPPLMTERASVSAQLARLKQFDTVRNFFAGPSALALLDLPFVFLFLAVMMVLAGPIALVPIVMLVGYVVFAFFWLPRLNAQIASSGSARTLRQRRLMDTLTGMRELRALGAEMLWLNTCREAFANSTTEDFETAKAHTVVNSVAHGMQSVAGIAVLGMGAHAVVSGDMSVGMLIAVMTLLWRSLSPLQTLFLTYVKFDQTSQVIRQINQLMSLDTEHRSARSALLIPKLRGKVSFDRVSFRYGPKVDPALLGASFTIAPGEFVAVIGGNGCGKSTVLKLLMGMYHPQAGSVSIDNLDLRQSNATDLRRVVAYVPQHPSLFYGTIEQNLRLADPGASAEQLRHACAEAGILDTIDDELPEGFATRIGDNSTHQLPAGFVHGICLARAFLRSAPILLLDEPGASLDMDSDERLVRRLKSIKGTRTMVMVSHRPSHIRLADRVITIERGVVTGIESPDRALEHYFNTAA